MTVIPFADSVCYDGSLVVLCSQPTILPQFRNKMSGWIHDHAVYTCGKCIFLHNVIFSMHCTVEENFILLFKSLEPVHKSTSYSQHLQSNAFIDRRYGAPSLYVRSMAKH